MKGKRPNKLVRNQYLFPSECYQDPKEAEQDPSEEGKNKTLLTDLGS